MNDDEKCCCGNCLHHRPSWETGHLSGWHCDNFMAVAIVLNQPSLDKFEPKIKPGGILIYIMKKDFNGWRDFFGINRLKKKKKKSEKK